MLPVCVLIRHHSLRSVKFMDLFNHTTCSPYCKSFQVYQLFFTVYNVLATGTQDSSSVTAVFLQPHGSHFIFICRKKKVYLHHRLFTADVSEYFLLLSSFLSV
ncbi:hypothetical protein LSH36_9g13019 [Paralvinella palmiformis]|uniref:Uncharacterized protein n=1 Tax=Paralvinella palmiformis TaxID=53620 RepID=A0AAD9KE05_9ANNE|nr:hypothetical protein LSH36_9g13019 [Paralvinella palmiformis]